MKHSQFAAARVVASLGFSGLALAQGHPGQDNRAGPARQAGPQNNGPQNMQRGPQGGPPGMQPSRNPHASAQHQPPGPPSHAQGRGAGPNHNFYKGVRLPRHYRSNQYVVNDWRGHRLSAPPRGYHWVQTGGDYVLVAVATGIIAQIFLGN